MPKNGRSRQKMFEVFFCLEPWKWWITWFCDMIVVPFVGSVLHNITFEEGASTKWWVFNLHVVIVFDSFFSGATWTYSKPQIMCFFGIFFFRGVAAVTKPHWKSNHVDMTQFSERSVVAKKKADLGWWCFGFVGFLVRYIILFSLVFV